MSSAPEPLNEKLALTAQIKALFKEQGKMNLLDNYRGESRKNVPISIEAFKFLLVCLFWFSAALGAGIAAAAAFVTIHPLLFQALSLPDIFTTVSLALAPLIVVLTFIPVNAMFLVLLERKLLALLTTRLGPNRVGFNGLFQTFADALKLLFKEDTVPANSDKLLFFLAPALFFAPSVIAFLPLMAVAGNKQGIFAHTDFASSLLFVIAVASIAIMGLVMAGWASDNKYALLGGLRSAAQAISYEIPLILSLVAFVLVVGSLDLYEIGQGQAGWIWDWNVFAGGALSEPVNYTNLYSIPFLILQVVLFLALVAMIYFCSLAEVNRIPFDLPEAESELVSGYNTEFSGMKFALFFLAEYTNLFISSALLAILFFGGPFIGIPFVDQGLANLLSDVPLFGNLSWLPGAVVLLVKIYLFIALAIWVRATLPRFRSDQLMGLAWKVLIPISLFMVLLAALCKTFVFS